ncbi:MAG: YqaA family protein [Deltaproteobacteria bacterium]|nr:YqaA family protein [Deltaproteobacteria bacterium]
MNEALVKDVPAARPTGLKGVHYRLYDWVLEWAAHRHARWALFGLAFTESSFFPVPPDVLLIAMALARPARARFFAAITTLGSVTGGIAGYAIGYTLWAALRDWVFMHMGSLGFTLHNFDNVQTLYQNNAFLAIFTAGFTPIPYKVFTIAAGVFEVALPVFILASVLGRGARFFLVAELIRRAGPRVMPFIERYLGLLTLAFAALLVLGFVFIKYLA